MPSTVILRTLDGDIELSHAFRKVAKPDGSTMIDLSSNGGDDGEGVDLHASTHFVGGTDSLASEYANIGDLTGGAYTLPMSSVDPGVTNGIIVTLPSGTLDSIVNGGANTVLRGGATGGGLTGMSFGSVTDAYFSGTLSTTHGGSGRSTYTAGDMPYYASGTALSVLPIGAADRILTSTGSAPQWVASLTKAQQHAQTAYLDGTANVFTGTGNKFQLLTRIGSQTAGTGLVLGSQTDVLNPGSLGSDLGLTVYADSNGVSSGLNYVNRTANGVGRGIGLQFLFVDSGGVNFGRGGLIAIRKAAAWTTGTPATYLTDFQVTLNNGTGALNTTTEVFKVTSGGTLSLMGAGAAGGVGVLAIPNATTLPTSDPTGGLVAMSDSGSLRVRSPLSAGALVEVLRLVHAGTTTSSAVGISFLTGTNGAQQIARIRAVQQASNVGDLVLDAQAVSGAGGVERLRLRGDGPLELPDITAFPAGNPAAGKVWLASIGGALKAKTPAGTVTTLAI